MKIEVAWGTTRVVVLVGNVVIKIARFRVLWIPGRLCFHLKNGGVRARIKRQIRNPAIAARNIFAGVCANWNEYRMWKRSPRSFLVPTLFSFGGLMNIQYRGERITSE